MKKNEKMKKPTKNQIKKAVEWINKFKLEYYDDLLKDAEMRYKALNILIPLLSPEDIAELIAELHDLRNDRNIIKFREERNAKQEI